MTELTLEESISMFMAEISKRHDENTNLIKELRASTDFSFRNQQASIKALEIQVRQISIILHEKLSGNLQGSIEIKRRVSDDMISTSVETDKPLIRLIMEYLVKISKKSRILELKTKTFEDYYSDIQYAVSIKEDTAYLCLHFTKDHKGNNINTS
ncbi:hypothetical protein Tco_0454616, partial [Tanacetum coccineum]